MGFILCTLDKPTTHHLSHSKEEQKLLLHCDYQPCLFDGTDIDSSIRQSDEVTGQDSDACNHDGETQVMVCGI